MTEPGATTVDLSSYVDLIEEYERAKRIHAACTLEVHRLRDMLIKLLPNEQEAPDGVLAVTGSVPRLSYRPAVSRTLDQRKLALHYPAVRDACTEHLTRWSLRSLLP